MRGGCGVFTIEFVKNDESEKKIWEFCEGRSDGRSKVRVDLVLSRSEKSEWGEFSKG